jgi:hypothetical protein
MVRPALEGGGSFSVGVAHGVQHPFRNFGRVRIAWITAVPSSSVTTPIRICSPPVDWSMNIVTAGFVGLECSPVVSKCVEHVVVSDTVLGGARLDVNPPRPRRPGRIVDIC